MLFARPHSHAYLYLTLWVLLAGVCPVTAQVKWIENKGQWPREALYRGEVTGGRVYLTRTGLRYLFQDNEKLHRLHHGQTTDNTVQMHGLFLDFVGGEACMGAQGREAYSTHYNFYLSDKPEQWASGARAYAKLDAHEVYPGVKLLLESDGDALKYTWEAAAGVSPEQIRMRIRGAEGLKITREGNLLIHTTLGQIVEQAPVAWQMIGDKRVAVKCRFKLQDSVLSYRIRKYDAQYPLVIDPKVIFATFSGSNADNFGFTATYDSLGRGYSGGTVYDAGFPTTPGAFQRNFQGGTDPNMLGGDVARDAGILKYSPDGSKLLFCTYLGGGNNEQPHSMVVNGKNDLIVFGTTTSDDFPTTGGVYDDTYNDSGDIFVSKFSADSGYLLASTYVGGSSYDGWNGTLIIGGYRNRSPLSYNYADQFRGEVISDKSSAVYVAASTASADFPVSASAFQKTFGGGRQDGCVFKLSADLSKLEWASFIGGSGYDAAYGLQQDSLGNLFATGGTVSPFFFNDSTTFDNTYDGNVDGYLCSISPSGDKVLNATYLGTSDYDQAFFVQLDLNQDVYLYGQTASPSFPVVNARYSNARGTQFITKFSHELDSVRFSTVFGSGRSTVDLTPSAFLVDDCGHVFVSGWGGELNHPSLGGHGGSTDSLPLTADAIQKTTDGSDFYLAVFAKDCDTLLYASYFGGTKGSLEHVDGGTSRFDKRGIVYQSVCGGCGGFSDFPTTPGAWSRINKGKRPDDPAEGGCNNLLFKLDLGVVDIIANFQLPSAGCFPLTVKPRNPSKGAKSYFWDFGDGFTSTAFEPTHTYANVSDTFTITLAVENPYSCSITDTLRKTVYAYYKAKATFSAKLDSCGGLVRFNASDSSLAESYTWDFGDSSKLSSIADPVHKYLAGDTFTVTLVVDSGTACADTISRPIALKRSDFTLKVDTCSRTVTVTHLTLTDSDIVWIFDSTEIYNTYPTFQFPTIGKHRVRLVIRRLDPCDTIDKYVDFSMPLADFSIQNTPCSPQFRFRALTGGRKKHFWDFGDGTIDTTANPPVHQYDAGQRFIVTHIVTDTAGCKDTVKKPIQVQVKPEASFTYKADPCNGSVGFENTSSGAASNFQWDFGDGNSSRAPAIAHVFAKGGTYKVQLITNPGTACADTAETDVKANIFSLDSLMIPNIITPNGDGKNEVFKLHGILEECLNFELHIFNRWGQELYHREGTHHVWPGTTPNGQPAPEGLYYFIIRSGPTGVRQGTITVIR